jgi:hypothetical protein
MERYNLFLAIMSGDIQYNETFDLINITELNYGLKNYDNKLSSDVERMILFDLEVLNNLNIENIKIVKKQFKNLLKLSRKYTTCYWYINEIECESSESSEKSDKSDEKNITTSNYVFWFQTNNEKKKISTYSEAMKLHLAFLEKNDYNMSELFLNIAKRMSDNPSNIYI